MYKLYVFFFILLGINIHLFGRDTTLFKIVTSTKPIRSLTKSNGNIIVTRYDGVFEFDGENLIIKGKTKLEKFIGNKKEDYINYLLNDQGHKFFNFLIFSYFNKIS